MAPLGCCPFELSADLWPGDPGGLVPDPAPRVFSYDRIEPAPLRRERFVFGNRFPVPHGPLWAMHHYPCNTRRWSAVVDGIVDVSQPSHQRGNRQCSKMRL